MERTKIEYIRNLKGSCMLLTVDLEPAVFEEKMLRFNEMEGILAPFSETRDSERKVWYDITGKQSLELALANQEMGQEQFCGLLLQLCGVIEKLEALLLDENGLLLEAESIFYDRTTAQIYFTYLPGRTAELAEALRRLMEYLLSRIDHKDPAVVKTAYEVYEKTLKEGYSLADIRESLRLPYETECSGESVKPEEKANPAVERTAVERKRGYIPLPEQAERVKKWISTRLVGITRRVRAAKKAEPIYFMPEEKPEGERHATVLLSETAAGPQGILRYEGTGSGGDIRIDKDSFVIGSGTDCDACIKNRAVSRRHAQITRNGDVYFIEDLNSANGTAVGGELLNYKTKMSLRTNEIILFANEKYRFL